MPTLNWIGKEAVVNHHQQVPFHLLKDVPERACGNPGVGNLIEQGDNLVALKALLPYYGYDNADSEEKRAIGAVWASRSGGRCLFEMPTGVDFSGVTKVVKQAVHG